MHRLLLPMLLLLATPAAPILAQDGAAYRPPQPPRSARVAVYRGNVRQSAPPVAIHRGSAVPPARAARVGTSAFLPVGGNRLWLVDVAGDRLIGCHLARTAVAGGRRVIRCSERRREFN